MVVAPASRAGLPSLTAWVYDSVVGASAGEVRLRRLRQRGAVVIEEAVTATWAPGAHQPRIGLLQAVPTAPESVLHALCTCLWPLQPARPDGPLTGNPLSGPLARAGIDQPFLAQIRAAVTPGTSALLVLALDVDLDEIRDVIERGRARGDVMLLHTWLTADAATHISEARSQLGTT